MYTIKVEKISEEQAQDRGVSQWPVWEKEESEFPWTYDNRESCFFIEGDVTVVTDNEEIRIGKGDFVEFPKGLNCTWKIHKQVKKYYNFG